MFKIFTKAARFFTNVGAITTAVMEGVVLVLVLSLIDLYVITPKTILNEDASTLVAAVKPILQVALLIGGILGAIAIIYFAATHSFESSK